jgi:hypothetical protein
MCINPMLHLPITVRIDFNNICFFERAIFIRNAFLILWQDGLRGAARERCNVQAGCALPKRDLLLSPAFAMINKVASVGETLPSFDAVENIDKSS